MVKKEHNIFECEQTLSSSKPSVSASESKKKYKGVRMRSWGSWVSEIRAPNQKTRIWLGSYANAEAAARAYDAALLCIKGSSAYANLNFPISLESYHHIISDHDHQIPSMSPKSIQRAAAAAAAVNNSAPVRTVSPPSPSASSSSAMYSSSLPSSDQQADDEVSLLLQDGFSYDPSGPIGPSSIMMDFWGGFENLHSPRFIDHQMVMGEPYGASLVNDVHEEGDIRLWSFC